MKYLSYREIRKHGTFSFPVAWYYETPRTPRYLMPFHWHDEYEIIRVLRGSFPLSLDGKIYRICQGECIIIPSGVVHGGTPEDCIYECIVFNPALLNVSSSSHAVAPFLQRILDHTEAPSLTVCPADSPISSVSEKISQAITFKAPGYQLATQGYIYVLFSEMVRAGILVQVEQERKHPGEESVKAALDFIADHYMEQIRLKDIAALAGMNSNYFCGLFKSYTGQSPMAYLKYYRVECACEKLAASSITVAEAAWECGFRDVGYFTRCFRRQKGVTPSKYLKSHF